MGVYTDNRFDTRHATQFTYAAPIGPHGRISFFWVNTKALPGYPGWHLLHMHADYAYSVDCTTRDVLGAIVELRNEWIAEVKQRWSKNNA
jgi:hypothetical protein